MKTEKKVKNGSAEALIGKYYGFHSIIFRTPNHVSRFKKIRKGGGMISQLEKGRSADADSPIILSVSLFFSTAKIKCDEIVVEESLICREITTKACFTWSFLSSFLSVVNNCCQHSKFVAETDKFSNEKNKWSICTCNRLQ